MILQEPREGRLYRAKVILREVRDINVTVTRYGWAATFAMIAFTFHFVGKTKLSLYIGMICVPLMFYGLHYLYYLWPRYFENQRWIFDDEKIRIKGAYRTGKFHWKHLHEWTNIPVPDLPGYSAVELRFNGGHVTQQMILLEDTKELAYLSRYLRDSKNLKNKMS